MANLTTRLGGLTLRNPVMTASGTFGNGEEVADLLDLTQLGAIVGKTVTRQPRSGNPPPRTCETAAGLLNAIGLQNVGLERFLIEKLPYLANCGTPVVVNVAGDSVEDFGALCSALTNVPGVAAIELNISCPNVAHGLDFATDPVLTEAVVATARTRTTLPLFAKLSPNVTDITLIARAAERGGADALTVANTFVGMAVNIRTRRPRLTNITGGLSGPAIKPLALRAVYRCAGAVGIPVIGAGGIASANDAVEFLVAGATAVQVGTATFAQPDAAILVVEGINKYLDDAGMANIGELVKSLVV